MKKILRFFTAFDGYLLSSTIGGLVLLVSSLLMAESSWLDKPFLIALNIANLYCFFFSPQFYKFDSDDRVFSKLLVLQIFLLIGMSFQQKNANLFFVALIPLLFAVYKSKLDSSSLAFKNATLIFIFCSAGLSFTALYGTLPFSIADVATVLSFSVWSCILFFHEAYTFKLKRKKKNMHTNEEVRDLEMSKEDTDKIFHHDLINITHIMSIFLKEKISKDIAPSSKETKAIYDEIKNLQSIVTDHFGLAHKNITYNFSLVDFDFIIQKINDLSLLMFNKKDIVFNFNFEHNEENQNIYYFPPIYRIINNLFKNIVDENSFFIELKVSQSSEGINIFLRNKIMHTNQADQLDLGQKLSNLILKEELPSEFMEHEQGLGLDSIDSLTRLLGGNFEFRIEGEYWINEVFIPKNSKATKIPSNNSQDSDNDILKAS